MPTIVLIVHQSHEDPSDRKDFIYAYLPPKVMLTTIIASSFSVISDKLSPIVYLVTEQPGNLRDSTGNHVALLQTTIYHVDSDHVVDDPDDHRDQGTAWIGMSMQMLEYAVHADCACICKNEHADENLIHIVHI